MRREKKRMMNNEHSDCKKEKTGSRKYELILANLHKEGFYWQDDPPCGFSMSDGKKLLCRQTLLGYLKTKWLGKDICYFPQMHSTNELASRLAVHGTSHGTVVMADHQTKGRGREGRDWLSQPGSGILLSFVYKEKIRLQDLFMLTMASSVGLVQALEKNNGLTAKIKWPNDLMIKGKKVCGILAEARLCGQNVDHVVVGIGMNVNTKMDEWPEEIKKTATSLNEVQGKWLNREELAASIMHECEIVLDRMQKKGKEEILQRWRNKSDTIGKKVYVFQDGKRFLEGLALDVNQEGALLIEKESNGSVIEIYMGDISIRANEEG